MPIYEYQCDRCGHHAEVLQKFSDPPITTCEHCKGSMRKLISQSAFHLKGSGWYMTDYARKSAQGGSETGEDKTKANQSGEASSDSAAKDTKKASKKENT